MENLPIFTVRHAGLSRWQSIVEERLMKDHPDLPISAIRNLPLSQASWRFVSSHNNGEKIPAPTTSFDDNNPVHLAYAQQFVYQAAYDNRHDEVAYKKEVETWPYSTAEGAHWAATTGYQWLTSWTHDGLSNQYRDYKAEGGGDLNYSVIDWKIPQNGRVALIGDWGTSNDDAKEFLRALISGGVDCIIHLGDVYYSGTKGEFDSKFINIIRGELGFRGPVFTIPGNHEYYSQGEGFYYAIDKINDSHHYNLTTGHATQAASYFCLRTQDGAYQFLGLDTGINDGNPLATLTGSEAPDLKSKNDYDWAIDKIESFSGKTIMLSHHQLFSHVGGLNTDEFGDSCVNPYLYQHFAPYFNTKIAAWYWGHEHSFAMYNEGAFGLNQGRLVGSSSYEQATSDSPYADNFPLVPYSPKNVQLPPNANYPNDHDADFYYPHAGAILEMRHNNNPKITYHSYPSWKNGSPPSNPQLNEITNEIISNPTVTPHGVWTGNKHSNDAISTHPPGICLTGGYLYIVYNNSDKSNHLYFDKVDYDASDHLVFSDPNKITGDTHSSNTDDDTPSASGTPALAAYGGELVLVYRDNNTLRWCTYDPATETWTKEGKIKKSGNSLYTSHHPTTAVFGNKLYVFYLDQDNDQKMRYATYDGRNWDWEINDNWRVPTNCYHDHPPCAVGVEEGGVNSLFLVYHTDSNSDALGLYRMDARGHWHDMGYLNNNYGDNNNLSATKSISLASDGRYLRMLLVNDDPCEGSVQWAQMDLGYYDDNDIFRYYDFGAGETGKWSGGIPVITTKNATMQTQSFAVIACDGQNAALVYPGKTSDVLWSSKQQR